MLTRRSIMKNALLGCAALTVGRNITQGQDAPSTDTIYSGGAPWGNVLGWRLGSQSWTFRLFPLEEAIKKIASLGLRVIEPGPNQQVRAGSDLVLNVDMTKAQRSLFRSILADNDVTMPTFAAMDITPQAMEFALDMGVETLMTEPPYDHLPGYDKLAQEYGIDLVIHNHPTPSLYSDYRVTLDLLKDLSPRTGVCLDTGHFRRSGFEPVEVAKALQGHIKTVHMKDLSQKDPGRGCHDVPWGTGVCDIPGVMAELKKQNFKGVILAEYEHNWENSLAEVGECARFFNEESRRICME